MKKMTLQESTKLVNWLEANKSVVEEVGAASKELQFAIEKEVGDCYTPSMIIHTCKALGMKKTVKVQEPKECSNMIAEFRHLQRTVAELCKEVNELNVRLGDSVNSKLSDAEILLRERGKR